MEMGYKARRLLATAPTLRRVPIIYVRYETTM